jgi:hypothetical protein
MEGRIEFDDKGRTRWHADPASHQGYLNAKMSDLELGQIIGQIEGEAGTDCSKKSPSKQP